MKMKVCFLSQEYPPETHVGGIGTYTYHMATALAKEGHTIHVITSTQGTAKTLVDSSGVTIHYVRKPQLRPLELNQLIYSYRVYRRIYEIKVQFDIVHASEYGNEALWFSFKKYCSLITRLATPFSIAEELNGKSKIGHRPIIDVMEKMQTVASNGIFTSTSALANKVSSKWKIDSKRIKVIPNSIDLAHIKELGKKNMLPEELNEKRYIVYFGRLEKRKGVLILAKALKKVMKKFPDIYMVFIGSDRLYNGRSMISRIKGIVGRDSERVIFYQNQPHIRLFPMVKHAQIAVLPSLWEAFGFVCVEAMALGKVVIATKGSGFDEIIDDGVSGYLVEPGNSESLSKKIIEVFSNPDKIQQVSDNAVKKVDQFDVKKIARKLIDYYRHYINAGRTEHEALKQIKG